MFKGRVRLGKQNRSVAMALMAALLFGGCATLESPSERRHHAEQQAAAAGWHSVRLDMGGFVLAAYEPDAAGPVDVLTIYIEGDGFAWRTSRQPSDDPSPRNPVALRLALRHPDAAAAWLGRPCQFMLAGDWRDCATRYWTDARFSEAVVAASDAAISELKRRRGAQRLELVGYSGGGAVAALVAARRQDVQRLVTVAGNLDHRSWTRRHDVSPLRDSLDPVDYAAQLAPLAQAHWVGGRDTVMERAVADSYAAHFPARARPPVCEISEATHEQGWVERWPGLLTAECR